ncbi:hypothetical protein KY290_010779 [Solanum tuberosum]|uniref:CCHC-type domain-containing protein n=1 Tax=Solanum tuberosum TaxID=4113 RepID=A0ABQ7W1C2_SOLTU|nr:hypothetical protein KY290_010779 [Solanum tuberosum]
MGKAGRALQDRSVTTRMLLQRRLQTFKMVSGTLLQDHLDAFNKLVMDLQTAGIKKDEETLAFSELFVRGRTSQQGLRKLNYRSKSRGNKKNAECWDCHKKGHFERDCPMSNSKEKASASIVEQVHDFDNDYVLTTSCNSGVYDNKWVLDSVGIGSVLVCCHDGIVRTIKEVCHGPDLKKKLISLGTLDIQGYKYMSEGGTMKVTKGSLVM